MTQLQACNLNLNEWQTKERDIIHNNMASSRTYLNFELKHRFNFSQEFWHQYISLTLLSKAKELAYMMYYFQNESECFIGKQMKAWGRRLSAFIVSRCLDNPIKDEALVLEITSHDHSQTNHKQRLPIRIVCYLTFLTG